MNTKTKIPFGWDEKAKRFKDAKSVPNGDKCGLVCFKCKKPLQAVQGQKRGDYFRHKNNSDCGGGGESLMHKMAKQIIHDNQSLYVTRSLQFDYKFSEMEIPRYDKQPDIYLIHKTSGNTLIVEIFYTHRIEKPTLECYWAHQEKVLEIDISCTRKRFFTYEELTQLVIRDAARELLEAPIPHLEKGSSTSNWKYWVSVIGLGSIAVAFLLTLNRNKRRRNHKGIRKKYKGNRRKFNRRNYRG